MMYKNRRDAGQRLGALLKEYEKKPDAIVLGLARGGIVVAAEIASILSLPLNVLIPRKLGAPHNPELAIGAIAEDTELWLNHPLIDALKISESYLRSEVERQKQKIATRSALYRTALPKPDLRGKIAILVDDGIATGATIFAEMQSLRKQGAASVVVVAPVAASDTWHKIQAISDQAICPLIDPELDAISQYYEDFSEVEDQLILSIFQKL